MIIRLVALVLLLAACNLPEHQSVPSLEDGRVLDLVYAPSRTSTGTGFTFNGDVHVTTSTTDEEYAVVFECQHGNFVVKGDRGRALFKRLRKGQPVRISYTDEVEVDRTTGARKVVGQHFVDAWPR